MLTPQTSTALRDLIASAIAAEKAFDVPGICRRYGLAEGSEEEAFRSKRQYVRSRLSDLIPARLLALAQEVQRDRPTHDLEELLTKISEAEKPGITELTRRRIVEALQGVPLTGRRLSELEFLRKIWPIDEMAVSSQGFGHTTLTAYLTQHRIRNDDIDNADVLEAVGIYDCSQARFLHFLETLVDPLTHEEPEQRDIIQRLSRHLAADGFAFREVGRISGSPRFQVRHKGEGTTPADSGISTALKAFSASDIHERWEEALRRREADPRAAITLARTLLEGVCKWLIIEAGEQYREKDELPALYKQLADILKLAPDAHTEQVFKQILGSCQSIVEALGALRNKLGDAHSQGPLRARPDKRHAELAVNLAGTMATFIVATWDARAAAKAPALRKGSK